ncbi:type IV secretion protein Rhs [Nostoc minutum NIES-26]|uniref:Type IV secretion protein Rhs n=1 Tax=Nostoc minutum NIES-26 TaxID=1844469 RepID=A0A367RT12_9NOSO|nr:VgrG-related protein [Dendronalium sp. ChiSLP03b]MDZ8203170.1 VgrG-related protein [Dendronalium sp. ChiSLP03b]RCJ39169.1 type IV secretion protein Rhs [Nostoc minutum NIES-26]
MPAVRYIPEPLLQIDGTNASTDLLNDILQISVEESLHLPGMFTLIIKNDYFPGRTEEKTWRHQSLFAIGKKIKIGFVSSTTENVDFETAEQGYVLDGEITAIETEFTEKSQAPIVIRGYDISHRLHRGRYNRSFQNVTDSDIVNQIVGETGIATGAIASTSIIHDYVFQENQTNMEFLRERAARLGFELYVQDGKLNFRQPAQNQSLSLKWLEDIHNFRVRVTSAEQVSSVEVRGWDYTTKRPIVSTASTEQVITNTENGTGSKTSTKFSIQPKMIVVDRPVFSANEAQKMAQALCNELGGEFVYADAKGEGNPYLRPGRVVKLTDMGNYSGSYYVTETRHLFHERIYTTEFSVRGLRSGDLLATLSPQTHLQPGQTLLVGIVSNNKDPKGWGRVRVKFPTLTEEHESNWARVVSVGAGPGRGFDCLPEVNDEVLVAFEHGDIHRPYVIGGVWNGTDAPPENVNDTVVNGKVRLRTFKTRVGHKLQFVEEDKGTKKGVYLQTTDGHNFRLNDSEKFAELETTGGHKFRCDDSNKTISLTSTGDITVKSGTTGTTKKISVNGGEIALTATQKITLTVGATSIELAPSGITMRTTGTVSVQAGSSISVQSGGSLSINSGASISASAGASISANAGATVSINGAATVGIMGGLIRLNC